MKIRTKVNGLGFNLRMDGSGEPFVWAHGLTRSVALEEAEGILDWSPLSKRSTLIRYDARGHGETQATEPMEDYLWSALGGDLLAIVDTLRIGRCAIGGQSMGSVTSLFAALAAPERFRALVLANPPTAWEQRAGQADVYRRLARLVEAKGIRGTVEYLRVNSILPPWLEQERPRLNELYAPALLAMEPGVVERLFRAAAGCQYPERERLSHLSMPTLILAWPDDPPHPLSVAEELNRLIPDSRLMVARAMSDVERWPLQIREFLDTCPR